MGASPGEQELAVSLGAKPEYVARTGPQMDVTLTSGFWMGETEVTQKQWTAIMGNNPSQSKSDDQPVEKVDWHDAMTFCGQVGRRTAQHVTLPTEAQWEFACRAGTATFYYFGDDPADLPRNAWVRDNTDFKPGPCGRHPPNAFGLHDMHGNVWEWCGDRFQDYPGGYAVDWAGAGEGDGGVYRGGCYFNESPGYLGSAHRRDSPRSETHGAVGFRVVVLPPWTR